MDAAYLEERKKLKRFQLDSHSGLNARVLEIPMSLGLS